MQRVNLKMFLLLLGMILPITFYKANAFCLLDGLHPIQTKEAHVSGTPRGSTIQASIDGHWLSVTFTQDIGTLAMELEKVSGAVIFDYSTVPTPDSYQFYLNQTGDYVITFTLSNGDEYYGEFTVTD